MSQYTPGPGDEVTWPPCTGHPNDPRSEPDERDFVDLTREEQLAYLDACSRDELIEIILELLP